MFLLSFCCQTHCCSSSPHSSSRSERRKQGNTLVDTTFHIFLCYGNVCNNLASKYSSITTTVVSRVQVKMNRMRLRIAQRLKEAQNTCAMLTTFNEVDMRWASVQIFWAVPKAPDFHLFLQCSKFQQHSRAEKTPQGRLLKEARHQTGFYVGVC